MRRNLLLPCLVLLLSAACSACSGGNKESVEVTKSQLGEDWPLTADSGTITCDKTAVIIQTKSGTYRMNGGRDNNDYLWVEDIQADDKKTWRAMGKPDDFMPKKSVQPLIDAGLKLCP